MTATRTRWRIGVLDSNPHSRAAVSRLIESRGATVVVEAPPRSESVALLRRLAPDAMVLAAEDAVRHRRRDGGPAAAAPAGRAAPDPRDRDRALPGAAASAAGAPRAARGGGGPGAADEPRGPPGGRRVGGAATWGHGAAGAHGRGGAAGVVVRRGAPRG